MTVPYRDGSFDLVVSVTSFDHWSDQLAGLRECHRVLVPGSHLVLVDQFVLARPDADLQPVRQGAHQLVKHYLVAA